MGTFEKILSVWESIPKYLNAHEDVNVLEYYGKLLGVSGLSDNYDNLVAKVRDAALADGVSNTVFESFTEKLDMAHQLLTLHDGITPDFVDLLNNAIHIDMLTPLAIVMALENGIPEEVVTEAVNGGAILLEAEPAKIKNFILPPYTKFASEHDVYNKFFNEKTFLSSWTENKELKIVQPASTNYQYFCNEETLMNFLSNTLDSPHTDFCNNVLAMLLDRLNRSDFNFDKPMLFINSKSVDVMDKSIKLDYGVTLKSGAFKYGVLKGKSYAVAGVTKSFPNVPYYRALMKDTFKQEMVVFVL